MCFEESDFRRYANLKSTQQHLCSDLTASGNLIDLVAHTGIRSGGDGGAVAGRDIQSRSCRDDAQEREKCGEECELHFLIDGGLDICPGCECEVRCENKENTKESVSGFILVLRERVDAYLRDMRC